VKWTENKSLQVINVDAELSDKEILSERQIITKVVAEVVI
jgi:hypothetical protein